MVKNIKHKIFSEGENIFAIVLLEYIYIFLYSKTILQGLIYDKKHASRVYFSP